MTSQENGKAICPESTLESANRRNFIRKAALTTAAVGIGGALLGDRKIIPDSSARSNAIISCCVSNKSVETTCVIVDVADQNPGSLTAVPCDQYALTFGACVRCSTPVHSGQGIASARTCSASNRLGLDFYTDYTKRLSITRCGNVGIGTTTPSCNLCVVGTGAFCTAIIDPYGRNVGNQCYGLRFGGRDRGPGCSCSGEVIASNQKCGNPNYKGLDFYTNHLNRVSITNAGKVGIGTTSPLSTFCVVGSINGQNGVLGGSICGKGNGVSGLTVSGDGVYGNSTSGTGVRGSSSGLCICSGIGVAGSSYCNIGVCGSSITYRCTILCVTFGGSGTGVKGNSVTGTGVSGFSKCGPGVSGTSCKVGVQGVAGAAEAIPIVAKGATGQTANLQQWEASCGTVYAVVNRAGSLGLGGVTNPHHVLCISGKARASAGFGLGPCNGINTTLAVNGSFAAKTRTVGATSTLATTDFAILATGTITLTLPPANTQNGMMIFIKNTSTSTVSVIPGGTDSIEGSSSARTLTKQYDSLTLISNGSNEWFIQSGIRCGVVIS